MKVFISALCVSILKNPQLASEIDIEALGKLLPKELLEPLEEQFLSKQEVTPAAATCLTLVWCVSLDLELYLAIFSFILVGFGRFTLTILMLA